MTERSIRDRNMCLLYTTRSLHLEIHQDVTRTNPSSLVQFETTVLHSFDATSYIHLSLLARFPVHLQFTIFQLPTSASTSTSTPLHGHSLLFLEGESQIIIPAEDAWKTLLLASSFFVSRQYMTRRSGCTCPAHRRGLGLAFPVRL